MTDKYLVNSYHGADDLEKASVTMLIASTAAAMDGETALFLTSDSVNLAVKGSVDGLGADGAPSEVESNPLPRRYPWNAATPWSSPPSSSPRPSAPPASWSSTARG